MLIPILVALLVFTGCQEAPQEKQVVRPVKALQVKDIKVVGSKAFPGKTRAEDRANLSFRVAGPLIELPVTIGQIVKKGDLLARIDPRDYEVQIQSAEAKLSSKRAQLEFAVSDFARAESIQEDDPGAISASMVDNKREIRNSLLADVKSLGSQLQAAKDALKDTSLRAPYDGTIVAKYVDNFEFVQAKQAVLRILGMDSVEMMINVPETLINYVSDVKEVEVKIDSFPGKVFEARVKGIGIEAETATRTYPVTLLITSQEGYSILAGMAGEARLVLKKGAVNAVSIPLSALFDDKELGKSFVWIFDPETQTVSRKEVKIESITDDGAMISSGLKSGDWIVTAGVHFLKEDQKVRLLDK